MTRSPYTEADCNFITAEWARYSRVEDIAVALGRSRMSVCQKILRMQRAGHLPPRYGAGTWLVRRHGRGAIRPGETPWQAAYRINYEKARDAMREQKARATHARLTLRLMDREISAGTNRKTALLKAHRAGLTRAEIGRHLGLTRQRIHQICTERDE